MDAVYPEKYAGIVTIALRDGRRLRKPVDYSKGMPENRMSHAQLNAKFNSLTAASVGREAAEGLLDQLGKVFDVSSNAALMRLLGTLVIVNSSISAAA